MYSLLIIFWDLSYLLPFKLFSVLLHEISHAIVTYLTGGRVSSIVISWNESGYTISQGGIFLLIASAGYLGNIVWGSCMLYFSSRLHTHTYFSIFIGIIITLFVLNFSRSMDTMLFFLSFAWALLFIVTAMSYKTINRYLLYVIGSITTLYSLFDLTDFINIADSDAGKIANYYIQGQHAVWLNHLLAYSIALLIVLLSVWIFITMHIYLLRDPDFILSSTQKNTNLPVAQAPVPNPIPQSYP